MRRFAMVVSVLALAACAKKDEAPSTPAGGAMAGAPMDLKTVAGEWNFKTMGMASDSVLTTGTLVATADTAGWTMTLPGRSTMALKITVSGDSIMAAAPQYESVLRKGVMVNTSSTYHLVGDKLIGTTVAHYTVTTADSVLALRTEGVRAPK